MAAVEHSIKVNNLPVDTNSAELRGVFETAGYASISDVYVPDKFLKQGFGFVRFTDEAEADQAAQETDLVVRGCSLTCEPALTEKRKSGGKAQAQGFTRAQGPQRAEVPVKKSNGAVGNESSVWVGNLKDGSTTEDLREAFIACGVDNMVDVYVPPGRGFGFVRFANHKDATAALEACENVEVAGELVELKLATTEKHKSGSNPAALSWGSPPPTYGHQKASAVAGATSGSNEYSVWVGNLPEGTTAEEIREALVQRGVENMTDVYIPPGRAFGFARFANHADAEAAMQACEGLELGGTLVGLELSLTQKHKFGSQGPKPVAQQPGGFWPSTGHDNVHVAAHTAGGERAMLPAAHASGGERSVWIGNLPEGTTVEELREAFNSRGIESMTDVYIPPGRDFGFVRFGCHKDAKNALKACQDMVLGDAEVQLKLSNVEKHRAGTTPSTSSYDQGTADYPGPANHPWGYEAWCSAWGVPPPGALWDAYSRKGCYGAELYGLKGAGPKGAGPKGWGWGPPYSHEDMAWLYALKGGYGQKGADRGGPAGDWAFGAYGAPSWEGHLHPATWTASAPGIRETHAAATADADNGKVGSPECSIWVGGLPDGATLEDLREAVNQRGIDYMTDVYIPPGRDFGFVRFATQEEAKRALKRCDGLCVQGVELQLRLSKTEKHKGAAPAAAPAPARPTLPERPAAAAWEGAGGSASSKARALEVSVKVGNLSPGTPADVLRAAFERHGIDNMTDVYVPSGKSFGFLRFARLSDAHAALRCSGIRVGNSQVECELAEGEKASTGLTAKGAGKDRLRGGDINFRTDASAFGTEVSIKVGNLPHDISPEEVCEAFAAVGIDSMTDCYIPQGRRFGFLRFQTAAEGRHALLRSISIRGQQLVLEPAVGTKRRADDMAAMESESAVRPAKFARSSANEEPYGQYKPRSGYAGDRPGQYERTRAHYWG